MSGQLLEKTAQAGLYYISPARREGIVKAAKELHFQTHPADISQCRTVDDVLHHLGSALHFPVWYGANFDALYDCLTDSEWQPGKGHVLLINGLESLRRSDPESFATLIEVFLATAEVRRDSGMPFWILIDTFVPDIPELPAQ
jgi:hypothetical protein